MASGRDAIADHGDGFVACPCGSNHWGLYGAAGLLLHDRDRGVLLQHRAGWTHHGKTWSLPGGALHAAETALEAALREAAEEAAIAASSVRAFATRTLVHEVWRYTTVLATPRAPVHERVVSAETAELRWVTAEKVTALPLHPAFAAAWPALRSQLDSELVLVVDAANVVGSRPDGWWRDRAGAAARLRDELAALARTEVSGSSVGLDATGVWSWWPRIVLVVEGKAARTTSVDGVEIVSAFRDGDSAIVRVVAQLRAARPEDHIRVVTADRELRDRVGREGADVLGPRTILDWLRY